MRKTRRAQVALKARRAKLEKAQLQAEEAQAALEEQETRQAQDELEEEDAWEPQGTQEVQAVRKAQARNAFRMSVTLRVQRAWEALNELEALTLQERQLVLEMEALEAQWTQEERRAQEKQAERYRRVPILKFLYRSSPNH